MGKSPLINIDAKALLGTLEERNTQIRELERQLAAKRREIDVISEKLGDEAARAEKAQEDNRTLSAIIAALDANAMQKVKEECNKIIAAKNVELIEVKAELQRCLGWIDAHTGKHPTMGLATDKPERIGTGIGWARAMRDMAPERGQ